MRKRLIMILLAVLLICLTACSKAGAPKQNAESAEKKKADYEKQGIGIISMRDDFKTIYGDGVQKTEIKQE